MKAKISIECESGEPLAQILTFLARQPLLRLHVDFEEEKTRKSNKPPLLRDQVMAQFPVTERPVVANKPMSKDLIRHALQDGPKSRRELIRLSYGHDLTTNALDWGIRDMKRRGEITETDDHVISLLNGEAKPPPLDIEARPLSGIEVILSILADGASHPRDELRRGFGKTGLKPKGFDARLSDAVARGLVERVGENEFRRTADEKSA